MTALVLVWGAGVAACGSDDSTGTAPPPGPHTPPPGIPEDGDAVVVQFTTGGGVAGPCCDRWAVPDITVYGDGRVVIDETTGPVPSVRQATVRRADLTDLVADAAEAGLLDDPAPDTGGTVCCDMGDTNIVLADATTTHELSVSGLGTENSPNAAELTGEQREVRQAIIDLRSRLETLAQESDVEYSPAELAVYVFAADAPPGVEAPPWPLDDSLAEGGTPIDPDGRCLHITTDSDTVLAAAAARGDASTIWASAGQTWSVIMRPLLPHEHACP